VYQLTHHVLNASPSQKKRLEDRLKRPKILLANSYEEAVELFDRNSDNMLGVITDVGYQIKVVLCYVFYYYHFYVFFLSFMSHVFYLIYYASFLIFYFSISLTPLTDIPARASIVRQQDLTL
jgi:hypothetical protein